jgi:hypothetical protein
MGEFQRCTKCSDLLVGEEWETGLCEECKVKDEVKRLKEEGVDTYEEALTYADEISEDLSVEVDAVEDAIRDEYGG